MIFLAPQVVSVALTIMAVLKMFFDLQMGFQGISGSFHTSPSSESDDTVVFQKKAQREPDQVLVAETLMEAFIDVVESYEKGTVFDSNSFESKMKELGEKPTKISVSRKIVTPCKDLSGKLHGAKKFYDDMTKFAKSMKGHKDLGIALLKWSGLG